VLRSIGAVRSSPLLNPSIDDLLLELPLTQWVSFDRVLIDGAGINALELVKMGLAQRRISRDLGERFLDRFALEKAMDQLAVVKIGHFDETHEGPAITLQLLGNIRVGIEGLGEFLLAVVLLDPGDDDLMPVFDDEIRLVVGGLLYNSNRTLERVKRGEAGPFTFPWKLQEIARTFTRKKVFQAGVNSAVTKWRAELESSGGPAIARARGLYPYRSSSVRLASPISLK
jgi:hypothetical protein